MKDPQIQQIERRLAKLEAPAVSRAVVTSDFTASEWETIHITAPAAGLSGLLPAANTRNKNAQIYLVFRTQNPVTLRAIGGTINGQTQLRVTRVGAYTAVSDGALGWWIESVAPARARDLVLQDWFVSGGTTSGTIGALGWNLNGVGTPAVSRNAVGLTSGTKLSLTTSGAANDRSSLTLGTGEGTTIAAPEDVFALQSIFDFNSDTANKSFFFGFASSMATAPASVANSLGFLFDSASAVSSTNILTIHRFGSTGTATDTGIAATAASGALFTIWQVGPQVYELRIGATIVATIAQNLNVSTLPLAVGFRLQTLTAAAKTMRLGYFGLTSVPLDGSFDDDNFLGA